jgi:Carboxypeptidase regulatory-like domain/TonB-dependent Receptor Plug Domain
MKSKLYLLFLITLLSALPASAQAVAASISGVVNDAQGAVVPGATVTLKNEAQGTTVRQLTTNESGAFVITPVLPGTYTLSVEKTGFKIFTQSGLVVNVADRIGLPPINLEVGTVGESVTVAANAVQLETVTAERSGVVTGRQMVDIALNGRNYTGLLKTVPGATLDGAFGGNANFNGQSNFQNNFTVDGQTVTDIGVNQQFAYRINLDAISEFKVSTNSQNAEFGRSSGAQIQVVTKSGTTDFHGTGWWFKRGEFMNANDFVRNLNGAPRSIYRFMQAGYNLGGPVVFPGFNHDRNKLFFFFSHEWGRSNTPTAIRQITVPTAAQRMGDFSQTVDAAGRPQTIYDPLTRSAANPQGTAFPGNMIPASRFNQFGPSVLNWLPMPNTPNNPLYNYQSQVSSSAPTFDQVYRVDYNLNDKWRFFVRALDSKSTQNNPYGRADSSNLLALSPLYAPTYGWSLTANAVTIISPTLTNEFQFGYTVNGIPGDAPPSDSPYYRSVSNINIPLLYPNADPIGLIPNFAFGDVPGPSGNQLTSFAGLPYNNRDPVWDYIDNVTKVTGNHTIKAGIFVEAAVKTESPFRAVNSTIDFGRDAQNPGDTNWAFSNALLGNFRQYTQFNQLPTPDYPYTNIEWYGQDTWKVTPKLTLNYGLRMSLVNPYYDRQNLMSNFSYAKYNPADAVLYYQPVLVGGQRVSLNPATGETGPAALIGAIVPGVGDINNGMVRSGQDGTPRGLIKNRGVQWGPRFGLAYRINDKTVFRMGGGVFYERIATFTIGYTSNYVTNPPVLRQSQILYGNLSTIPTAATVDQPASVTRLSPDGSVPTTYNYSAGIQRELPLGILLDASYVGSQNRHLTLGEPFNYAPFGSAWLPQNQDPTLGAPQFNGTTTLPVNLYRPIAGYLGGTQYTFGTSTHYNALQVAINRRAAKGLNVGVAYTWSKAIGVDTANLLSNRAAGYGPLSLDRTQVLTVNYIYDIPSLARTGSFLDNRAGKMVFDGWQFSGLTSISSGAPVNVNYSISGVSPTLLNREITGSEDVRPRVVMNCNPNLSMGDRNLNAFIDTSCFAPAAVGSTGNDSGWNRLRGPGINQWDMSLFKKINFTERAYVQLRLEAFNAFNTTQWASFNSNVVFNAAGTVINLPTQLGGTGGRFGFGTLNATRANSQRIVQVAAKFYF